MGVVVPLAERLQRRTVVASSGCHEWIGHLDRLRYGRIRVGQRLQTVHRAAYELFVGPIPEGYEIDHLCRNRRCWWPPHLEAVTHLVNMQRGANSLKARCPKGHLYDYAYPNGKRGCRICIKTKNDARPRRGG